MRKILNSEIFNEKPNSSALGAFNYAYSDASNKMGSVNSQGFSIIGNVRITIEKGYIVSRQNGIKVSSEKYSKKAFNRVVDKRNDVF